MGRHHGALSQRMDLLGGVGEKGRDAVGPCEAGGFGAQGRNAPPLLLDGLHSSQRQAAQPYAKVVDREKNQNEIVGGDARKKLEPAPAANNGLV